MKQQLIALKVQQTGVTVCVNCLQCDASTQSVTGGLETLTCDASPLLNTTRLPKVTAASRALGIRVYLLCYVDSLLFPKLIITLTYVVEIVRRNKL